MALVWVAVTLLISLAALGGSLLGDGSRWWALLTAATFALAAVVAGGLLLRRRAGQSMIAAIAGGAVAVACLAGVYVPRLQRLWLSSAIAATVERETGETQPLAISTGTHEPSLVFLLGTQTRLTDLGEAARIAVAAPESIVVLAPHGKGEFLEAMSRAGARVEPLGVVDGLNYSKGRPVHLSLVRVAAAGRGLH